MDPFAPAATLLADLRSGECTPLELLDAYLERIERLDPGVRALVQLRADEARDEARGIASGPDAARPLLGLPMTVKEAFDLAGTATTWGMPEFAGNVVSRDAVVVERLRAAGAVVFGKTNVPTNLADFQSYNDVYGTTRNPWDPARTPGGSSGGSAAALAAGFTGLEVGSDIGGSIRNPAHFCGVFGHKPTWALVPSRGHALPGALVEPDIAVVGPLARSAGDLALAMGVLTGPDAFEAAIRYELPTLGERRLRDLRVAVWADDALAPVSRAVRERVLAVAGLLRDAGARVDEEARPEFTSEREHEVYFNLLHSFFGGALPSKAFAELREEQRALDPEDDSERARVVRASVAEHRTWLHFHNEREKLRWAWHEFFQSWDVVVAPIMPVPAFPHDHRPFGERTLEVDGHPQPYFQPLFWAGLPNAARLPSTVVPTGPDDAGLPIGIQIIGPAYGDLVTIGVAELLEREGLAFQPPPGFAS